MMVTVVMAAPTLTASSDSVRVTEKVSSASKALSAIMSIVKHCVAPFKAPEVKVRLLDDELTKSDPTVVWSELR